MAKIFTIAHRKGGVGKTTLATNLAVALSNKGKTLLVDTDDQKSAYNWNEYRQEKLNSISVIENLGKTLQPLNDEYEFILIDIAGRDSEVFREALLISDKLIVPTQASILDLELLPYIADKVTTAHKLNPDLKAYIVINRANANPKNNEVAEAKKFIAKYPIFKLLNTVIHDRKQFRDAIIGGLSVSEMGSSKAHDELNKFLIEVL